jgi:hypothetical protein
MRLKPHIGDSLYNLYNKADRDSMYGNSQPESYKTVICVV